MIELQVLHAENEALSSPGSGQPSIAEMLVEIMEAIFEEASHEPPERQKVRGLVSFSSSSVKPRNDEFQGTNMIHLSRVDYR